MTTSAGPHATIERRRALLEELRNSWARTLDELAQVCEITPTKKLYEQPAAALPSLADFFRRTDLTAATEDGRIWMATRLGLYIARYFIVRYRGSLELQADASRRFYLEYVVTGMELPITPDAIVAPFAIAHDMLNQRPKPELPELIHDAERSLLAKTP
jgi:hypothetical protein